MRNGVRIAAVIAVLMGCCSGVQAALVMDTVPVGNAGNAGELSGYGDQEHVCGAVSYSYNIGKYEVTAGQYTEFLNAVAADDTYELYSTHMDRSIMPEYRGCNIKRSGVPGSYTYNVAPDWANRPVNYVNWANAARFTNWLHNGQPTGSQNLNTTEDGAYYLNGATTQREIHGVTRQSDATWVMPTEDEWYKAAYHKNNGASGDYFDYPTSSDTIPSNDLIDPDPGNNATFVVYDDGYDYTLDTPYHRTEVGAHENSASPYGTFDQGGNAWEWNETEVIGGTRGIRGGSFIVGESPMHAMSRYQNHTEYRSQEIGFRVAYVPEPATLILLALAGIVVLRR